MQITATHHINDT